VFTVVLLPVFDGVSEAGTLTPKANGKRSRAKNAARPSGFQVTVPSLPGVVTFGRSESEAMEMARDAILCHIEGLKEDGEEIPSESTAQFRKLRISA
jgi:predicted RNase H-like HicB family nuclease